MCGFLAKNAFLGLDFMILQEDHELLARRSRCSCKDFAFFLQGLLAS